MTESRGGAADYVDLTGHLTQLATRYGYSQIEIFDAKYLSNQVQTNRPLNERAIAHLAATVDGTKARWIEVRSERGYLTAAGVARRVAEAGRLAELVIFLEVSKGAPQDSVWKVQPRTWPGTTELLREEPGVDSLARGPLDRTDNLVAGTVHRVRDAQGDWAMEIRSTGLDTNWQLRSTVREQDVYGPLLPSTLVVFGGIALVAFYGALWLRASVLREAYHQAVRENSMRRYYEEILTTSTDLFVLTAADGRIVDVNASAVAAYGYTKDKLLSMHAHQLVHASRLAEFHSILKGLAMGQTKAFSLERVRADGSTFMYEGLVGWIEIKGIPHYHSIGRDVTLQRQQEARLRTAASMFEHSSAAVVIAGQDCKVLLVNPAFTEMTGWLPDEVLGKPVTIFTGEPSSAAAQEMRAAVEVAHHWEGDLPGLRKSGELYPRRLLVTVTRDSTGAIEHLISMFMDQSKLKLAEAQIEYLAQHDMLTGLPNRAELERTLPERLQHAGNQGLEVTLALLNLDRFKQVNDVLGTAYGDELLVTMSTRLRTLAPAPESLYRYGGDEFVFILPGAPIANALRMAQLQSEICAPVQLGGHDMAPTASIGTASFPAHAGDAHLLLSNAAAAMRNAKASGRNTWRTYQPEMNASAHDDLVMAADLRKAIDTGQLELHFQPQYSLSTGHLVGMEALLRWSHPIRGRVSPAQFVPLAEAAGLVVDMSAWVLREACRQWSEWRDENLSPPPVAINLSPFSSSTQASSQRCLEHFWTSAYPKTRSKWS